MPITIASALTRMAASARAIESLVRTVPRGDAVWKPSPEQWSILEVVNHLADEEVEDFRARLDIIVNRRDTSFPPVDPQGWVVSRG